VTASFKSLTFKLSLQNGIKTDRQTEMDLSTFLLMQI